MNITTICLTSNRYVHLIPPFAWCWRHFWPRFNDADMTIVHYDTLPPLDHSESWMKLCLGNQDEFTWSSGLLSALEGVTSDIVLLVLEDYWLDQATNHNAIAHARDLMEANPLIGKIDLSGDRMQFPHEGWSHPNYVRALTESKYYHPNGFKSRLFLMSYQAALWRVDFLRDHLRADEDPWQSEENGTRRLVDTGMLILGHKFSPLHYTQAVKGGKPHVLQTRRFNPAFLDLLRSKGLLSPWGM